MSEEFNLHAKDDDPRSEKTLSAILGNYDGELDNPESRVEAYLLAIKEMLEGGGGGGGSVTVDTELKPNSTNPVQNKAIKAEIDKLSGNVNTLYGEVRGTLTSKVNQLEGLQSQTNTQLSNLNTDYQTTKSTVAQHNGEISGINSHLNGVDSALNGAFSMVDGLQSRINDLEPRVSSSEQALTVNMLNPTSPSGKLSGITVVRNADNSYTISGTNTSESTSTIALALIASIGFENGKTYRVLGCPSNTPNGVYIRVGAQIKENGEGANFSYPVQSGKQIFISIVAGTVIETPITIKPMITTNLSATYDDFVPYTGDTGKLCGDVADIKKEIEALNDVLQQHAELLRKLDQENGGNGGDGPVTPTTPFTTTSVHDITKMNAIPNTGVWVEKTWNGYNRLNGNNVWTDGTDIYYSEGTNQKVLDKSTSTWVDKTWNGRTDFMGLGVWTDGTNIYCRTFDRIDESGYNYAQSDYILNKSTSTWSLKQWNWSPATLADDQISDTKDIVIIGDKVCAVEWDHGQDKGMSMALDKSTSTWSKITYPFSDYTPGKCVWTDGNNCYVSYGSSYQKTINTETLAVSDFQWNGDADFSGDYIWSDGTNIYYSYEIYQKVLDKSTLTWSDKKWNGDYYFSGEYFWSDGTHVYYSNDTVQYVLT